MTPSKTEIQAALAAHPRAFRDTPFRRAQKIALWTCFMGTLLGAVLAFPLSLLGAKNINRIFWLHQGSRRLYDVIRAFETLILALIFIRAFGLGPLPGILAIAVSEIGTFAKLFSEALENTSRKPVEGVVA